MLLKVPAGKTVVYLLNISGEREDVGYIDGYVSYGDADSMAMVVSLSNRKVFEVDPGMLEACNEVKAN